MSTVVKDLGAATAYGYAVEKGYTGTEAEFAELMASYATVGQTAVTAAQTATTKALEAATSATTATNKASEATTAATTATTAAEAAQADADAAALDASQAMSAASTATTKATEATTAAATATSAATTATTAKDDAVSAKTAAQTAQTGAETAAASVSASAAQIATNTEDIESLKSDLTAVESEIALTESKSYFRDDAVATDIHAYINTDGTTVSYENAFVSDYMEVIPSSLISYNLKHIAGISLAIAFYDTEKTFISGISGSGTGGAWVFATGESTAPSNAKYIKVSLAYSAEQAQYAYYVAPKSIKTTVEKLENDVSGAWTGKQWAAFGTSITDTSFTNVETGEVTGKYVPFLQKLNGAVVTNYGIAGGTLGRDGIHGGSGSILNKILSTDISDFDLITIEGFVNDFACAITIGDIGDTQNTTFYGALHQAISYCLEHSHAEVVLITETTGKLYTMQGGGTADYTILHKNSLDLYQQAYNDAMIRIGQYYGVHVIDAGGKSQINQYHPEYIIDQIHHTALGGEQYAKTIWEELKNIKPSIVSA